MTGGSDMGDTLWLVIFYNHLWAPIRILNKRCFFSDWSKIPSLYDSLPYKEGGILKWTIVVVLLADSCLRCQNVFVTICWLASKWLHGSDDNSQISVLMR